MIFVDLETRARVDLRICGGHAYARCPDLGVIVGCALDSRPRTPRLHAWAGQQIRPGWQPTPEVIHALGYAPDSIDCAPPTVGFPDWLAQAIYSGVPLVAHNAWGFDELVWDAVGYPPAEWLDSAPRARRRGLPGGLEAIGQRLFPIAKDPMGKRLVQTYSVPQKGGNFVPLNAGALTAFARYCAQDVLLLAAIWTDEGLGDPHPDDAVLEAHRRIDRRGVLADLDLAERLLALDLGSADDAERAAEALGVANIRSVPQTLTWLRDHGQDLPDLTAPTVLAALAARERDA